MSEDIFEAIVRLRKNGIRAALAIIIAHKGATPRKDSVKMLLDENGHQLGNIGGGTVELEVCRLAREVMDTGKSQLLTFNLTHMDHDERALVCGGSMQIYLEPILPDPTLFIFGAGHVGQAVAHAATLIGFKIKVLDDRPQYVTSERFPDAETILVEDWEVACNKLEITSSSYIFIATQRPHSDRICLRYSVKSSARYIGMLGSFKKTRIVLDTLEEEGIDRSKLDRVLVPAGLDIDSETPEEIAASIMPELIAARKNLDVRCLRDALRSSKKETYSRS
jgi:xanthine dehydrogenase accessory factor